MFGYATNETKEMLDLPFVLCQRMAMEYDKHRKEQPFLKPDGKCQITMEYIDNIPKRIHTIIFSHQHTKDYKKEDNYNYIKTYDLTPRGIINHLNLTRPIFEQTARYGHFVENKFL